MDEVIHFPNFADGEMDWQKRAVCTGQFIFFPNFDHRKDYKIPEEISAFCNRCPVSKECLDFAIRHNEYGIWANTNEKQRVRLRRQRNR